MSVDLQQSSLKQAVESTALIHLEAVSKSYKTSIGPVKAVDNVSLRIERGEWINVQGSSGSGKSTLLSLICGLTEPDRGNIFVDNQNVTKLSQRQRADLRAKKIGFVFQMFHLLPYLSVLDNIQTAAAQMDNETQEKAKELAARFKIDDRLSHRPGQLSIGQRQRVALARALFNEPIILLADEPTGNLDAENSEIVVECFDKYNQGGGTILLVSHDPRISDHGDRSLTMSQGQFI